MNTDDFLKKYKKASEAGSPFSPATLLFLMAVWEDKPEEWLEQIIKKHLDEDLEAELCDGSMYVWVYSVAFKHFGVEAYKSAVHKMLEDKLEDMAATSAYKAFAGISLVVASRYTGNIDAKARADNLFAKLLTEGMVEGKLKDSELNDYASVLLFATYLYEESFEGKDILSSFLKNVEAFKDAPGGADEPFPAPASVAAMARYRVREILEDKVIGEADPEYAEPLSNDFYNLFVFLKNGKSHDIHVQEAIAWKDLPVNVLQMKGPVHLDCYGKMCRMYPSREKLLESLNQKNAN